MIISGLSRGLLRQTFPLLVLLAWLALSALGDAAAAEDCAEHQPYGAPIASFATPGREVRLCVSATSDEESFFALGYDRARGVARWAAYRLTRARLHWRSTEVVPARRPPFRRDRNLEALGGPRLAHADFTGSGYDRGHLVPAAAMRWRTEAYAATFRVSNLALQNPNLNRGIWRRLEAKVRTWACALGSLYVITGTLDAPLRAGDAGHRTYRVNKGTRRVSVPAAFYKLLFSEAGGGTAMAVVSANPNPGKPASAPLVLSVDDLETLSGLDFFPNMAKERQHRIEAAAPDREFWETRLTATGDCSSRRASAVLPRGDRGAGP